MRLAQEWLVQLRLQWKHGIYFMPRVALCKAKLIVQAQASGEREGRDE